MRNMCKHNPAALRYLATFTAGAGAGAGLFVAVIESKKQHSPEYVDKETMTMSYEQRAHDARRDWYIDKETVERERQKAEKKLRKFQKSAQERVRWKATDQELLGLTPRLWMEVFDKKHRYAGLLYNYWRRFQLSDSNSDFFDWLDYGMGSLIDLPEAPRRLLDEWQVIYLSREQQPLFRVIIEPSTGRFLWEADGTPVTIPFSDRDRRNMLTRQSDLTARERAVYDLLSERLRKMSRRDDLLAAARQEVEDALASGEEPTAERLSSLTSPLIQESLLCQLRDPFFEERHDAAPTPLGHRHHRTMPRLPETLLPGIGWHDVLRAIRHDQGEEMGNPIQTGEDRLRGNAVFVLDSFGPLYCGVKIRGVLQHSSFVRGHCVKLAGGVVIKDGWLVELSPHSGHYQPGQETVKEMIQDWEAKGVDFSHVNVIERIQKMK